jgi:phage shock protein A
MSLLSRLGLIVRAKLSSALDRSENTAEILDYSYARQREMVQGIKLSIADVVTAKKRLELQQRGLQDSVSKLEGQARMALTQGREDLARTALERKSAAEQQRQSLDEQIAQLDGQQHKLVETSRRLTANLERFRTEKEVLKAQHSAAQAQVKIGEALTGLGGEMGEIGLAIDRTRERTQAMMARANAIDELTAAGTLEDFTSSGDHLDRELARLSSASQVNDDLARLKAELGQGQSSAELPAGKRD